MAVTTMRSGKRSRRTKAPDTARPPALVAVLRGKRQVPTQSATRPRMPNGEVHIKAEPPLAQDPLQPQQHQVQAAAQTEEEAGSHDFLQILEQPPATWYKDQCGRKATFEMRVRRVVRNCASCRDRNFLRVELLYQSGRLVENQDILRIVSGLSLNKNNESILGLRIMEVSKNHLNQRFRIRIKLPPCLEDAHHNVHGVVSDPICVLSKKNKRPKAKTMAERTSKKRRVQEVVAEEPSNGSLSPPPPLPAGTTEHEKAAEKNYPTEFEISRESDANENPTEMMQEDDEVPFSRHNDRLVWWANAAHGLLQRMQWLLQMTNADGSKRLFQCPSCQRTYERAPMHEGECELGLLLQSAPCVEAQAPSGDEAKETPDEPTGPIDRFAGKHVPSSVRTSDSSLTLPPSFAPSKSTSTRELPMGVSRLIGPMSSISKIPLEKDSSTMSTLCAELFNADWKMGPESHEHAPVAATAATTTTDPNGTTRGFPSLSKVLLSFEPSRAEKETAPITAGSAANNTGDSKPNNAPMTDVPETTTSTGVTTTCDFGTLEAGSLGLSEMSCINLNNLSLGLSQVLPGVDNSHATANGGDSNNKWKKSAVVFSKKELFSVQEIAPPSQLSSLSRIQLSELLRSSKLQE